VSRPARRLPGGRRHASSAPWHETHGMRGRPSTSPTLLQPGPRWAIGRGLRAREGHSRALSSLHGGERESRHRRRPAAVSWGEVPNRFAVPGLRCLRGTAQYWSPRDTLIDVLLGHFCVRAQDEQVCRIIEERADRMLQPGMRPGMTSWGDFVMARPHASGSRESHGRIETKSPALGDHDVIEQSGVLPFYGNIRSRILSD
jgi:hypothetical protein